LVQNCFRDYWNPDLIEHTVEELVAQRVYGLALGESGWQEKAL
jgi:hypothetical protein